MIYAIGSAAFVKIGKTNDVVRRLTSLQVGSPLDLEVLACADWPDKEEGRIHTFLWSHHKRGEWFDRVEEVEQIVGYLSNTIDGLSTFHARLSKHSSQHRLARILALK
jgi:hypothetical protein